MWSIRVACLFVILFQCSEAKTYYFNQNKTTSEFLIYSRVNLNNSLYDDYGVPSELINKSKLQNLTKNGKNETYYQHFIDREWNYNWTNITSNKLPVYITKLYDMVSLDLKAPIKILFNHLPINSTTLKFNFSSFKGNISHVELHFYYKIENNQFQKPLIIRLYQIEDSDNATSLIKPDSHKLLNVIYLSQAETGWQIFKLNKLIQDWLSKGLELDLFITISKPNDNEYKLFKDSERGSLRTFLTVKMEASDDELYYQTKYRRIQNSPCRKQEFIIDFEKLNWNKFIIAPHRYDAFTCVGKCFRDENLTNHMKLAKSQLEFKKKSLCCVPTHYSPLPIMFYNKLGNIDIKLYPDMVISGCSCR